MLGKYVMMLQGYINIDEYIKGRFVVRSLKKYLNDFDFLSVS